MSQATAKGESALTPEVKAVIGAKGEKIEASLPWGVEREGLRIFTQAIMDPDPRYWDDEFAKKTKYKAIITPPIYVSYLGRRARPGSEDPVTRAFSENPNSDGIGGVRTPVERGDRELAPHSLRPGVRDLSRGAAEHPRPGLVEAEHIAALPEGHVPARRLAVESELSASRDDRSGRHDHGLGQGHEQVRRG